MNNINLYNLFPFNLAKLLVDESRIKELYLIGLEKAIASLTEREQDILLYRYLHGLSYRAIGDMVGISHERVRQLEAKCLRILRSPSKVNLYFAVSAFEHKEEIAMLKAAHRMEIEKAFKKAMLAEKQPKEVIYETDVYKLELSVRPTNCLKSVGVKTVGDLARMTEKDLMNIRSMGVASKNEIVKKLAKLGVSLKEV